MRRYVVLVNPRYDRVEVVDAGNVAAALRQASRPGEEAVFFAATARNLSVGVGIEPANPEPPPLVIEHIEDVEDWLAANPPHDPEVERAVPGGTGDAAVDAMADAIERAAEPPTLRGAGTTVEGGGTSGV